MLTDATYETCCSCTGQTVLGICALGSCTSTGTQGCSAAVVVHNLQTTGSGNVR